MSMKIGISTSFIEPSRNSKIADGVAHYTVQLWNQLQSRGYETKGYAFPGFCQLFKSLYGTTFPYSFPMHALMNRLTGGRPYEIDDKIDVFHSTDHQIIPMTCPVVATIWDAAPLAHPEWFYRSLRQRLRLLITRNVTKYADKVIAVSEHAAQDLVDYYKIDSCKIEIIPWGIDPNWLKSVDEAFVQQTLQKYNLQPGYILSVGTLQPKKNFERLIEAYTRLPIKLRNNHKLVIVGKYGGAVEVVNKINGLVDSGVVWLSSVDSDEALRAIYQQSEIVVFPSLYEGFGMPILEAFASNVPLITSNITSMPEVCGDAAIKINPYSSLDISRAMEELLTDVNAKKELIAKGHERLKMFNWESTIEKTLSVYHSF